MDDEEKEEEKRGSQTVWCFRPHDKHKERSNHPDQNPKPNPNHV